LVVRPAALDHITLTPATATIIAGGSQAYAVEGFDQYGNDMGSLASSTNLSVSGYSCSNMSCQASTAGDLTVTATSGGTTATPANLTANVKGNKVNLTWQNAPGATSYVVYRGTSSSNLVVIKSGLTSTSFTDGPGSGTFYYEVIAVGPSGLQSAPSNVVSATFK